MDMPARERKYDVVIVGASVAGCAAALLYAREGLSVALLDKKRSEDQYKRICTTYIQKSAYPVLHKLGIDQKLVQNGALPNGADLWTRYGWIKGDPVQRSEDSVEQGYCIRRSDLDPFLVGEVLEQSGIDLLLNTQVDSLKLQAGVVSGVHCKSSGTDLTINAKLVVGADGRYSTVAKLLDIPTKTVANDRSAHYAFYENAELPGDGKSLFWLLEPDAFFAYPYSGNQTLMCCFISREKSDSWKGDLERHFDTMMTSLPNSPCFDKAKRVSQFVSMNKMDNNRRPAVFKGCALVGDAALSADPLSGVGCGWAFQSADMLVATTALPIKSDQDLSGALARYAKLHRKKFWMHDMFISESSKSRKFNTSEKMLAIAATSSRKIERDFHQFISRSISPWAMFNPGNIGLIIWSNLKHIVKRTAPRKSYDFA